MNGGGWASCTGAGADAASYPVKATGTRVGRSQEYRCVVTAPDGSVARTEAVGFAIAE